MVLIAAKKVIKMNIHNNTDHHVIQYKKQCANL